MNAHSDEQTAILRAIWQEMKNLGDNLGSRIDRLRTETTGKIDELRVETNARLDQTNARLDLTNARLEQIEESVTDLAGQQLLLGRFVRNTTRRQDLTLVRLDERVTELERRLPED